MSDLATKDPTTRPEVVAVTARTQRFRWLLKRPSFVIGASGLVVLVFIAAFAPLLTPYDPVKQDLKSTFLPPFWVAKGSLAHPLGTDTLGRDVASRMMYGARNSLLI